MNQNKSPCLGGTRGGSGKHLDSLYPSAGPAVNVECSNRIYFRQVNTARRNRTFCRFTGEPIYDGFPCEFFTLEVADKC